MFIFFHEIIHLIFGTLLGLFAYKKTKKIKLLITAIIASLLIDIDHLFDFFFYVLKTNVMNFSAISEVNFFAVNGKVIVPLHSYELQLITIAAGYFLRKKSGVYLIVIGTAMFVHTIIDQLTYRPFILEYSLIYRVLNNFSLAAFK